MAAVVEDIEVLGDSAYASGDMLHTLDGKNWIPLLKPWPLKPAVEGGFTIVDFDLLGADALAIYSRLHSTDPFVRLAVDSEAPYVDTRALAQAGVAEVREYMGRGMLGDEDIGQDSDIVRIVFGG